MPSTYTLNNGIELIGTGEQSGTWGDTTNTNLELLDTALDGQVTITATSAGTSGSPNDLPISDGSASDGRNRMVIITSATDLGADVYYQLTPNDAEKIIYVRNDLNTQDLILFQGTYNASNDYVVPNGKTAVIFFDGAGTGAVAANVFNNAHFDALNVVGDVTIGDDLTLNSDGAIINIGADNDLQITHSGTEGIVTNATGDLTFDVAGDIVLDFDGGDLSLKDGGTERARLITGNAGYFDVYSPVSDQDVRIRGIDGASIVDAVTFDMSEAGAAIFNAGGVFNESSQDSDFRVESNTNTHMLFVDASTDRVGIKTTSPGYPLTVSGANASSSAIGIVNTTNSHDWYFGASTSPDALVLVDVGNTTTPMSFYYGAPTNSFIVNNGATVFNENGLDQDFRVESDTNQHMLFVDAGNNHVNIGTSSDLNGVLGINGLTVSDGADNGFRVVRGSSAYYGQMYVNYEDSKVNTYIDSIASTSFLGQIILRTSDSASVATERLKLSEETGAVFNESGADQDFRVESDNTSTMLFVDAGNDRVGINNGSPSYTLDVGGDGIRQIQTGGGSIAKIRASTNNNTDLIMSARTTDANGTRTGIVANGYPNASYAETIGRDDADFSAIGWTFYTLNSTYEGQTNAALIQENTSGTETRLIRASNDGGIIFNEDSVSSQDFRVESDSNTHMLYVNAGDNTVRINNSGTAYADFFVNGDIGIRGPTNFGTLEFYRGGSSTVFARIGFDDPSASNDVFVIDSSGNGNPMGFITNADEFAFYTGGVATSPAARILSGGGATFNENGNDSDFRVESDGNSHAFLVDALNSRIGINNSTPSWTFDAVGNTAGQVATFYDTGTNGGAMYNGAAVLSVSRRSNGSTSLNGEILRVGRDNADSTSYNVSEPIFTVRSDSVVVNDGQADIDFRVESDNNTYALFFDAANNALNLNGTVTDSMLAINPTSTTNFGLTRTIRDRTTRIHTFGGSAGGATKTVTIDFGDYGLTGALITVDISGHKYNNGGQYFYIRRVYAIMEESGATRISADLSSNLGFSQGNTTGAVGASSVPTFPGGGDTRLSFTVNGEYDTKIWAKIEGVGSSSVKSVSVV